MKEDDLNNIELRSLGVRNLLDKHPHWLILKGNFVISVVLLLSLSIVGYFVKYPDFVSSKIIIEAQKNGVNKVPVGKFTISQNDLGKVKKGQKVIIKLYDFPYQEFGILEGQVREISSQTNEKKQYYVGVVFPKGLKTSYNKKLPSNKELKGNSEVIIKDLRLIDFIFNK